MHAPHLSIALVDVMERLQLSMVEVYNENIHDLIAMGLTAQSMMAERGSSGRGSAAAGNTTTTTTSSSSSSQNNGGGNGAGGSGGGGASGYVNNGPSTPVSERRLSVGMGGGGGSGNGGGSSTPLSERKPSGLSLLGSPAFHLPVVSIREGTG